MTLRQGCISLCATFNASRCLQEWITPQPSRRPEPIPDFEKLETPRIRPLPGDPELPDEEEEEENEKKKKEPEKDPDDPEQDPEKPEPAKPPGER